MINEEKNFITLTDEDDVEKDFELIDECTVNGHKYVAVVPAEYYILKRVSNGKKEDTFESIEGKELETVASIFEQRLNTIDHDKQ